MTLQEFCTEIDTLLEQPPGTVKGTDKLADIGNWDSMAVISFIAMADAKLQSSVTAKQISGCQTVADLAALFPGKVQG